jgi:hypothetical protein
MASWSRRRARSRLLPTVRPYNLMPPRYAPSTPPPTTVMEAAIPRSLSSDPAKPFMTPEASLN